MYLTVQQVTNYHSEAWQDFIAFKNQFLEAEKKIEEILAIRVVQEGSITGVTQDKKDARINLTKKGLEIQGKVYAYASVVGNNKLKNRVNYTRSEFSTCRDTAVIEYIQIILNAAGQFIVELADFDVKQEDLDKLKALNDEFSTCVENPRQAITNRVKATKYLKEYFKQTDKILKERLDKMMDYFREKSPDFWHQYKSARKIIDLGY